MSCLAIRVENLSKKYFISHQPERGHHNYTALRDVITDRLTAPWRSLASRLKNACTTKNGSGDNPLASGAQLNFVSRTLASALAPREDFWALKDVSFEINHGEVVGIIGRNGAGKSTLLKILSQITEPTKGRIEIEGRVGSLLEVGTGFHPELTGRENIYLNGAILGMPRLDIKRKFDEIVAFAEVEKFLDTPVKRYSSGMYVRLAFSVAAHLQPDVLVVDEVLAVGDTQFQRKCIGKMQDISTSEGRTVLFVSHNLQTVKQMCERVLVLERGNMAFDGLPHEGFAHYLGQHAGAPAMHVDLSTHQRAASHDQARFLSIAFSGIPAGSDAQLTRSDTLCVKVTFEVLEPLLSLDIAMAVVHVEGQKVFSESYIDQFGRLQLDSGRYVVEFLLPLRYLKLESYFLALGLYDDGRNCDLVEGIPLPQFTDRNADAHLESHRWGIVRIPVQWSNPEKIL
jgi:lipopolysaccharide transport system ATP-binding protein